MTRKDFKIIASAIQQTALDHYHKKCFAETLAQALKINYPNFDNEKFLGVALSNKEKPLLNNNIRLGAGA